MRLFVDMDGTLAKFAEANNIEQLYEENYFKNLPVQKSVIDAVKDICENHKEVEVYILSAVLSDSSYAENEKNDWLDRNLPEIDKEHRIFCPCGEDKSQYIPGGIKSKDVLLDDYSANLNPWTKKAQGLKLLNGMNNSNHTWHGSTVSYESDAKSLSSEILKALDGYMVHAQRPLNSERCFMIKNTDDIVDKWQTIFNGPGFFKAEFDVADQKGKFVVKKEALDGYFSVDYFDKSEKIHQRDDRYFAIGHSGDIFDKLNEIMADANARFVTCTYDNDIKGRLPLKKISQEDLDDSLDAWQDWIQEGYATETPDLRYTDFTGLDFKDHDLSCIDFTGSDFSGAKLSNIKDASMANFKDTNLITLEKREKSIIMNRMKEKITLSDIKDIKPIENHEYYPDDRMESKFFLCTIKGDYKDVIRLDTYSLDGRMSVSSPKCSGNDVNLGLSSDEKQKLIEKIGSLSVEKSEKVFSSINVDKDKLEAYLGDNNSMGQPMVLEFENAEACRQYMNLYDHAELDNADDLKAYIGDYGFEHYGKLYVCLYDEALDIKQAVPSKTVQKSEKTDKKEPLSKLAEIIGLGTHSDKDTTKDTPKKEQER